MSHSVDRFLHVVGSGDFNGSSRVLGELSEQKRLSELISALKQQDLVASVTPLRLRDHVFTFLSGHAVYFALEIQSFNLLESVDGLDPSSVRESMLKNTSRLLGSKSPELVQYAIDAEEAAESQYAVILPSLLEQRVDELQNCIVPFTVTGPAGTPRTDYCVANLLRTSYGRRILLAIGKADLVPVISEKEWKTVAKSVKELGHDPDAMLKQVETREWAVMVKSIQAFVDEAHVAHKEIVDLRALRSAWETLRAKKSGQLSSALREVAESMSSACNKQLMTIAQTAIRSERLLAIQALVNSGGIGVADHLEGMLSETDETVRTQVARGFSELVSHEFRRLDGIIQPDSGPIKPRIHQVIATDRGPDLSVLSVLARHKNPLVRLEAARTLSASESPELHQILAQMAMDADDRVRYEVVKASPRLSSHLAAEVLRPALSDKCPELQKLATKLARERWSDSEFPI